MGFGACMWIRLYNWGLLFTLPQLRHSQMRSLGLQSDCRRELKLLPPLVAIKLTKSNGFRGCRVWGLGLVGAMLKV